MIAQQLARLEQLDLKKVWSHEAVAFTPWLARDENIALLGEALGLDQEVEADGGRPLSRGHALQGHSNNFLDLDRESAGAD